MTSSKHILLPCIDIEYVDMPATMSERLLGLHDIEKKYIVNILKDIVIMI